MKKARNIGYQLEALEERLLLSADPVLAPLAGTSATVIVAKQSESLIDNVSIDNVALDRGLSNVVVNAAQTLSGSGAIDASVHNAGTLSPGNSPGKIIIANDLVLDESSVLDIEIGQGNYDQIVVDGSVFLNGKLNVVLLNDYRPEVGDTFDIISSEMFEGQFDSASGLFGFDEGHYFEVNQSDDGLQLIYQEMGDQFSVVFSEHGEVDDQFGMVLNYQYFDQTPVNVTGEAVLTVGGVARFEGLVNIEHGDVEGLVVNTGFPDLLTDALFNGDSNIEGVDKHYFTIGIDNASGFLGFEGSDSLDVGAVGFELSDVTVGFAFFGKPSSLQAPDVNLNGFSVNLPSLDFSLPELALPEIVLPNINVPQLDELEGLDISLPKLNLELPDIDLSLNDLDIDVDFELGAITINPSAVSFENVLADLQALEIEIDGEIYSIDLASVILPEVTFDLPSFSLSLDATSFDLSDINLTVSDFVLTIPSIEQAISDGVDSAVRNIPEFSLTIESFNIKLPEVTFGISDFNLSSLLGATLPSFYALKANVGSVKSVGLGDVDLDAKATTISLNSAGKWLKLLKAAPAIDFQNSFESGHFDIAVGGETVELDFAGDQIINGFFEDARLNVDDFAYFKGDVSFEIGHAEDLTIATGLPANILELLGQESLSEIQNIDRDYFTLAVNDADGFLGIGEGYDENGDLVGSPQGVVVEGMDLAFAYFKNINTSIPNIPLVNIGDPLPSIDDYAITLPELSFVLPTLDIPNISSWSINLPDVENISVPGLDFSGLAISLAAVDVKLPELPFSLEDIAFPISFDGITINPDLINLDNIALQLSNLSLNIDGELFDVDIKAIELADLSFDLPEFDFNVESPALDIEGLLVNVSDFVVTVAGFELELNGAFYTIPDFEITLNAADLSLPTFNLALQNTFNFGLPSVSLPTVELPT
ncbi:LEPR-XLL domain-containing protein, partial [Pseudomonadota bacterium]|nr:LEPR-XLL domain-containing protein [Pseudomonadota bacterium]